MLCYNCYEHKSEFIFVGDAALGVPIIGVVGADAHISPIDQRECRGGDVGIAPYIFNLSHMRQILIYLSNRIK